MKKQKTIRINYHPLQVSGGIEVIGSVPGTQVYQADLKEYTPDYTLTPLTLMPRCNATDPSAYQEVGNVNAQLTNLTWHELCGGVRKLISSDNTDYEITASGNEKGKLTVKRNVLTTQPVTLDFRAEYVERSGEKLVYRYLYLLRAVDGTEAQPVIVLDSPSGGLDWNPVRHVDEQVITARMLVGNKDVTDLPGCKFFWSRLTGVELRETVSVGGDNDFEVKGLEKNKLTIDRRYMGMAKTYEVRGAYNPDGVEPSEPDETISPAMTTIRRKLPAFEVDWSGLPDAIPPTTETIQPTAIVRDTLGNIERPERFFKFSWYKEESDGRLTLLANGISPRIAYTKDMRLVLDVQDLGPYCIITYKGKAITYNGKLAIARKLQP